MKRFIFCLLGFFITASIFAQTIKIDFRYDFSAQNTKTNRLIWTIDGVKTSDHYDAVSNASVNHTTLKLKSAMCDSDGKTFIAPKGLYELLLFALASPKNADSIKVETSEENKITIKIVHRGNAYEIRSSKNGKISTEDSFFLSNTFATNEEGIFKILEPYALKDSEVFPDWQKLEFKTDGGSGDEAKISKEKKYFSGTLTAKIKGQTLFVKGKLKLTEKKDVNKPSANEGSMNEMPPENPPNEGADSTMETPPNETVDTPPKNSLIENIAL